MLKRFLNGLVHPVLALRYVSRRAFDSIYDRMPEVERFIENQIMDRRVPRAINAAREAGLRIDVIYDIGARHGYWSEYLRRHVKADYILFEANEEHAPLIARRGFRYFTGILSDAEKDVSWYGKGGTGDSYYKENTAYTDDIGVRTLRAHTLDHVLEERGFPLPDLIKLDTQGAEIDILNGGPKALSHATLVYSECSLVNYNQGAPLLTDMLKYMTNKGFVAWDIGEEHRKAGALIQLDILFIRREAYQMVSPESSKLYY